MWNKTKNQKGGNQKLKKWVRESVGCWKKIVIFFGPQRVQCKKPFGNRLRESRSKIDFRKWRLNFKWPNYFKNRCVDPQEYIKGFVCDICVLDGWKPLYIQFQGQRANLKLSLSRSQYCMRFKEIKSQLGKIEWCINYRKDNFEIIKFVKVNNKLEPVYSYTRKANSYWIGKFD